jgi:hypothetical protein
MRTPARRLLSATAPWKRAKLMSRERIRRRKRKRTGEGGRQGGRRRGGERWVEARLRRTLRRLMWEKGKRKVGASKEVFARDGMGMEGGVE